MTLTMISPILWKTTAVLAGFLAAINGSAIENRHLDVASPYARSIPVIEVTLMTNLTLQFASNVPRTEHSWGLSELDWKIPADFTRYQNMVIEYRADFAQPFEIILKTHQGPARLGFLPYQNVWSRAVIPLREFSQFPEAAGSGGDITSREGVGFVGLLTTGPWQPLTRVERVTLAQQSAVHPGKLEIRLMKLTSAEVDDEILEKEVLVDEFLQWKRVDWTGKAKTSVDLQAAWDAESATLKPMDAGYTKFGGYAELPVTKGTGFFRVEEVDGKWWFITPEGHRFYSVGVNWVDPRVEAPYGEREFMFAAMPPKEELTNPEEADFGGFMLKRRFGSDWEKIWTDRTFQRLAAWGFNTAACWTFPAIKDAKRLPYCQPLTSWGRTVPNIKSVDAILDLYKLYGGLPDVYHPQFAESADMNAAPRVAPRKDDPWLLGYFVTNSPPFAGREELVAERILGGPATATRQKLEQALALGDTAERRRAFMWQMYDDYLAIVTAAIRRHDPNHLIIGIRFADEPFSDELLRASRHMDVFSYAPREMNSTTQEKIRRIVRVTGRPVLLDAFGFGAPERGLSGGLVTVRNQRERGGKYREYVETAAAMPEVVGTHYSRWGDDPAWGNDDGQNRNTGIIDVTERPYPELVAAMQATHARLREVREGKSPAYLPPANP